MSSWVTVVSGLPRSGTSMMMQMLRAGGMPILTDGARAADESNPWGYLELEAVKRTAADASWVAGAVGKAVKVIYALLDALPAGFEYRVILMQRDVDEVLASQRAMLSRLGQPGAQLSDARMQGIFTEQIAQARRRLIQRNGFSLLEVDYSDCLRAPSEVAHRVNLLLGGLLDEQLMARAVVHSFIPQLKN